MRSTYAAALVALSLAACGDGESQSGPSGERGTGGSVGVGGEANGGAAGTGGSNNGSGGQPGSGGTSATSGGRAGTGGAPGAGGFADGDGGSGNAAGGNAGGGGSPVVTLPPGSGWLELEDTSIAPVCACNDGFPEVCANSGCGGIFAWSSGAYDTRRNRMLVFGGGHSDYFGNEIYALSMAEPAMSRINDPGLPLTGDCSGVIAGGTQPSSRHTYDALLYLEHADRLFLFGGSKTPCGYLTDDTWTYSFADSRWEARSPTGPKPAGVPGIVADYDPVSHLVFLHDDDTLYSYDDDTDTVVQLLTDVPIDYHMSGILDPARRKLVLVGAGKVYTYDLDAGYTRTDLATTGGSSVVDSGYPGLAYDPAGERVMAWNGGDSVYALDVATGTWIALTSAGGPGDANGTGTYKRFRHVPGTRAFVLVNRVDQNAFLFRL